MVSSLIYYKDTHEFYEKHYDEIEDIRCQLEDDGIEVNIPQCTDLKNFYAWLSFEQRAYELQNTLEMDGHKSHHICSNHILSIFFRIFFINLS